MQKALLDQSKLLMNPSPAFYNLPSIELASRLTSASVFDRVFFANSGGEANEAPSSWRASGARSTRRAPTRSSP